ncbi:MAG: nucleotidyltransferase domain-containing protein [Cyanobacteria bacterium J06648_16]
MLTDRTLAKQFSEAIRQQFPDAQIWALADSDWDFDFCVVLETLDPPTKAAIRAVAWELSFANETVLTTIKFARRQFEQSPITSSPLVQQIRH